MFIQTVTLKKDGWYCRLQKSMFGEYPTFENFCPFFWLTVFCVMAAPIFFGAKWFAKLCVLAFGGAAFLFSKVLGPIDWFMNRLVDLAGIMDKYVCLPTEEVFIERMDDSEIYNLYRYSRDRVMDDYSGPPTDNDKLWRWTISELMEKSAKKYIRLDRKFQIWKEKAGDGWRDKINAIIEAERTREAERIQRYLEEDKAHKKMVEDRAVDRKRMLSSVVKYTKWVAPIVVVVVGVPLIVLALVGLFTAIKFVLIALFAVFVAVFVKFPVWAYGILKMVAFEFTTKEILPMVATTLIGMAIMALNRKCDLEVPATGFVRWIAHFDIGKFLKRPIEWLAFGAIDVVSFFVEYFKAFKKDHCPGINWVD